VVNLAHLLTDSVHALTVQRPIRSFVIRGGRLTTAQRRALDSLWSRYGLEAALAPAWDQVFGRCAPRFVEVGFGNGDALLGLAARHPERDYLGIDVHLPGVGRLLGGLEARALRNVRVMRQDAVEVFERWIPDASLDGVYVWFPDPWPKKRHHKRRLVQPPFAGLVTSKLKVGGLFHLATDWEHYAGQMLDVTEHQEGLVNLAGEGRFAVGQGERPPTRFQRRGERLGHRVWDLMLEKRPTEA